MFQKNLKKYSLLIILVAILGLTLGSFPVTAFAKPAMQVMIPMRDGARLSADVYLPDPAVWGNGPYPAIISRTPYGISDGIVVKGQLITCDDIAAHGYAAIFQHTRGRYSSEGIDNAFLNDIEDGYDTVEWAAAQSWCNGKVGTTGGSASGITSEMAAADNPPHLKAVFAEVSGGSNLFNNFIFEGGATELETTLMWLEMEAITLAGSSVPQGMSLSMMQYLMSQGL
ncbi:MAG TPA: CocE/NonD family hydrolase, partial [Desulfomonilia bacterium]|nr:CocE/NonD family hydrolase [Desulfomonilia bacterium]